MCRIGDRISGTSRSQWPAKGPSSRRYTEASGRDAGARWRPGCDREPRVGNRRKDAPGAGEAESIRGHARPKGENKRKAKPPPWGARRSTRRGGSRARSDRVTGRSPPHGLSRPSRTSTESPARASTIAADNPLGPEPTTTASYPVHREVRRITKAGSAGGQRHS